MKRSTSFLAIIVILLAAVSCEVTVQKDQKPSSYKHVFIIMSEGYNNLSSSLRENIWTIRRNYVPDYNDDRALVVVSHNSVSDYNWETPTQPVIFQMYKRNDKVVMDTLARYNDDAISCSPEMVTDALTHVASFLPSEHYGLLYTSHGSAWIPANYKSEESAFFAKTPESKQSIGMQIDKTLSNKFEIDIEDFAKALPFDLDYILMDCCLMSSVEVLYALKDKCKEIVASPTEIIDEGFDYNTLIYDLLGGKEPQVKAVAQHYYQKYASKNSSATVCYVQTAGLDKLADAFKPIAEAHRDNIFALDRRNLQSYNYSLGNWLYDFRDVATKIGATEDELKALDEALSECVVYKAATPSFLGVPIDPDKFSGLSIYVPDKDWKNLNAFYRKLSWNKRTGYIE